MYIGLHNHTAIGSNTRGFLDSINRVEDMVKYAKELGMPGLCITDHDSLTAHIDLLHYIEKLKKDNSDEWKDFKAICGNEVYLTSRKFIEEKDYSKFYHFILIAKDEIGYQQLRNLSTKAWVDNFFTYVNPRTPTYYDDLFEELEKNPGHLIASTACLGGQLDRMILEAYEINPENPDYSPVKKFLIGLNKKFGEGNFFLEMQPSRQEAQIFVNNIIIELSKELSIPYIITTDAHYLKKEDREIHKAFLLSDDDGGAREVDDFYETTYFMSEEEIHENMDIYIGANAVTLGLNNTMLIYNQCEEYSLDKPLDIPYKAFDTTEPSKELYDKYIKDIPLLEYFFNSEHDCDRHMCREILNKLEERPEEFQNKETYDALHDCLNALITSSEAQHTQWSGYLLVCKELIKTVWESGSLCGPGRGSGVGFFLLYMLDITQVNPLREDTKTYYWRFLHEQRASVLDIDFDSEGSKKDLIIENLRKKYGGNLHVTKVQTISTAKSKKALQIAARGLGYTAEEGIYMGSFIRSERGIMYTLAQTYYGDPENGIEPDTQFQHVMDHEYPDVWKIAQRIEGLCVASGAHAGGVILSIKPLNESCPLMRTRAGEIITGVDLHKAEDMGLIKYDVLNIDALEKIHAELNLLLEDGYIEWQGSLKDTYEKYLGVYNIERNNPKIWDMIDEHKILSLFQFEKMSGYQAVELGKPRTLVELTALNSVMRLMPQEGQSETPLQIYNRHMNDIQSWYDEMDDWGLTKEEQEVIKLYAGESYGLMPSQEAFMIAVQDERLGGWDLIFADKLRKSVAKKQPKDFMELERQFFERVKERHLSYNLCSYAWMLISQNKGYSFNNSHVLAYSIVGLQEANLAYHYPVVYWNTACLIADSGGQDSTVRYEKIAAAVGRMIKEGINIVPPYINEARFGFKPDAENNKIVYGLKAVNGIGADVANAIVANQPYTSALDFYNKMQTYKESSEEAKFGDASMIALIKSGAFDTIETKSRQEIMEDFIKAVSNPVSKITQVNVENLIETGLLTELEKQTELRYIKFKKYVCQAQFLKEKVGKSPSTYFYKLEPKFALPYFNDNFADYVDESSDTKYIDGELCIKRGKLEKLIEEKTSDFMRKVNENPKYIKALNEIRYKQVWKDKVKNNNISRWEMDSMNFYFHEHELAHVNQEHYNLKNFDDMPTEPVIAMVRIIRDREVPRYALDKIIGTVIGKDTTHNTITLLTLDGVVTVRFYKGQFTFYARELVEKDRETGKKTIIEKSWFKRGTQLMVTGVRIGEQFIAKNYKDSIYKHSVQLIKGITEEGLLELQEDRAGVNREEEDAIRI